MASMGQHSLLLLATGALSLLCIPDTARAQAAAQVGGRPPKEVETQLCSIGDVFAGVCVSVALRLPRALYQQLMNRDGRVHSGEITTAEVCLSGCASGTGVCPAQWYPSSIDECSSECGLIFEPFVRCHNSCACHTTLPDRVE